MIVIDMQKALVGRHPYNEQGVLQTIRALIAACREQGVPVLYVQHDGGVGDELEYGSCGWELCTQIKPAEGDPVFDKRFNSAFRQTELREYLESLGAKSLIMCGMQTEFCFDVSCKVAFEYGYSVTVPAGATTTFDSDFASGEALARYFEEKIWNDRYAQVVSPEVIIAGMSCQ